VFVLFLIAVTAALTVSARVASAGPGQPTPLRFATFNASLNRNIDGQLMSDLAVPGNAQADAVAEIIQRIRPDVLLINEFDYDAGGVALQGFLDNYLGVPHGDAEIIEYPYTFIAPSNTGIHSGLDLNNDTLFDPVASPFNFVYANDSFGFGWFPGQFGMAVLSRYPIDTSNVRTFQQFLWKDMPGAMLPTNPDGSSWYTPEALDIFRLSSKSHWDVPIQIDGKTVHFLTSHPTPPVFDDPDIDQNGTRNNDEIRFWADYIIPSRSGYIYDDNGQSGGLPPGALFVIAGDQNSDPFDGDSVPGSIQQLLEHPLVNTKVTPDSEGGPEQAILQDENNDLHLGDPAFDTADFSEASFGGPGNLRADYVLPRKQLLIFDAGVFWPTTDDPLFRLTGFGFPVVSSDHRLVWVDVRVPSN
jgi:hypothetical protein